MAQKFLQISAGAISQATALAGPFATGATVPASPVEGEPFLHTPTGRKILLVYANGAWAALESFGTTTLYVDGGSGTNAIDKGYGTGSNAFATIQYAIDQVPGLVGGNVTINIAAGTYNESVIVQGKTLTGNYTITLLGAMTDVETITASSGVTGGGATQGTITRNSGTWTTNQRQHLLLKGTSGNNNNEIRVIDSNTTTVATIVGKWSGAVVNGDTFKVQDWATIISGVISVTCAQSQVGLRLEQIKTTGSNVGRQVYVAADSYLQAKACLFTASVRVESSTFYPEYSAFVPSPVRNTVLIYKGFMNPLACKFARSGSDAGENIAISAGGLYLGENGYCVIEDGLYGIWSLANGYVNMFALDLGSNIVRNCTTGVYAQFGGQIALAGSFATFSGNTTNIAADAASYAYAA